jgi:methylaspartate ammonia-lyase
MTTKKAGATTAKVTAKILQAKKPAVGAKSVLKSATKPGVKAALQQAAKKSKKERKTNVVRDSFTMPQNEYAKIAEIKEICLKTKMHVKKSEVLRAGLVLLAALDQGQMKRALGSLEKIKTGRPQKY